MGRVLSIDLALHTRDFGICMLTAASVNPPQVDFLSAAKLGLQDPLSPRLVADGIYDFCTAERIGVVLLDGPQGWKDAESPLPHCRQCEKLLNTPAKTGTVGIVKPASYGRFVEFCIGVFDQLVERGAQLALSPDVRSSDDGLLALESFPFAAWRKVGIPFLPSKGKHTLSDIEDRFQQLRARFKFASQHLPSHDQLQALLCGFAGLAIQAGNVDGFVAEGSPPRTQNGVRVEGFIVSPVSVSTFGESAQSSQHPAVRFRQDIEDLRTVFWSTSGSMPSVDDIIAGPCGPSSPHVEAAAELSAQKWKDQLLDRLKGFFYPYPTGRNSARTFYAHLERLRAVSVLLEGETATEIRLWLQIEKIDRMTKALKKQKQSAYGYPLAFHQKSFAEIKRHIKVLRRLVKDYNVQEEWIAKYLRSAELQLLHEAWAMFNFQPFHLYLKKRLPHLSIACQLDVYDSLIGALSKLETPRRGIKNLAIQLTALICSPQSCLKTRHLNPSPEAVRKKIEYREQRSRRR